MINNKKLQKLLAKYGVYLLVAAFALGMVAEKQILKSNLKIALENGKLNITTGAGSSLKTEDKTADIDLAKIQEEVLPQKGFTFKINWGTMGKKLVDDGVIDKVKLAQAITGTDILPPEMDRYLDGSEQKQIELNSSNAQFWVDVLWGLGLANKNDILEEGPMTQGGQTANFASTGGYTIGAKKPMDLYNKFSYIKLTPEQQVVVKEIADGVYRPCCNNATSFPDCNHGMAALALIEMMVSQGFSKDEIYKTTLAFNSYWFPQTYLDIAYHFKKNGREFKDVKAAEILSKTFSSASGYQALRGQIGPVSWPALQGGKGGCGA